MCMCVRVCVRVWESVKAYILLGENKCTESILGVCGYRAVMDRGEGSIELKSLVIFFLFPFLSHFSYSSALSMQSSHTHTHSLTLSLSTLVLGLHSKCHSLLVCACVCVCVSARVCYFPLTFPGV